MIDIYKTELIYNCKHTSEIFRIIAISLIVIFFFVPVAPDRYSHLKSVDKHENVYC